MRSSSHRGYIPLELLWVKTDPGYPGDLKEPPYDQIKEFLGKVRTALQQTKPGNPETRAGGNLQARRSFQGSGAHGSAV